MISRRHFLFATAASVLLPRGVAASSGERNSDFNESVEQKILTWPDFQLQMETLADGAASRSVSQEMLAEHGQKLLKRLDIASAEFKQAVDDSYETGNRYWLWQRLLKTHHINGGILNIDSRQLVQLHDHPGATGMVRIISGETEVWQFDLAAPDLTAGGKNRSDISELTRVSHRVLKAGDMAVLNPDSGNIHALRAIDGECRMLDFFIPPYQRNQRSWYEPLEATWFDSEKVTCRRIPQHAFTET